MGSCLVQKLVDEKWDSRDNWKCMHLMIHLPIIENRIYNIEDSFFISCGYKTKLVLGGYFFMSSSRIDFDIPFH